MNIHQRIHQPNQSNQPRNRRFLTAVVFGAALCCASPAFAVSKDMVQLQTQIQQLQDAVARLQQSNDERMGVMKDLIQQSADSINKMSGVVEGLQKQMQAQQEAQSSKSDQLSGQIQSLNDSVDEIKARIGSLQKLVQDVQSQQQSMNANMPSQPSGGSALPSTPVNAAPDNPPPAPIVRRGKPSAAGPPIDTPPVSSASSGAAAPADELYKTALGDYMAAKYALAASEFGDVVKNYPDNPLSGNAYYYQAEIAYRGGKYAAAIKAYDAVIDQYPDSNKVPVAHLHKGMALVAQNQKDAGVREFRNLIQRYPNSPEAMQARSKLSGMGITVTPK
jgi:tol-pal system protein YbgF